MTHAATTVVSMAPRRTLKWARVRTALSGKVLEVAPKGPLQVSLWSSVTYLMYLGARPVKSLAQLMTLAERLTPILSCSCQHAKDTTSAAGFPELT